MEGGPSAQGLRVPSLREDWNHSLDRAVASDWRVISRDDVGSRFPEFVESMTANEACASGESRPEADREDAGKSKMAKDHQKAAAALDAITDHVRTGSIFAVLHNCFRRHSSASVKSLTDSAASSSVLYLSLLSG